MFQFANPQYLYLLLVTALFVVLEIAMKMVQRRRAQRLGDITLLHRLTPGRSSVRPTLKRLIILLAATALMLVLARPQFLGRGTSQEKRKGIEVVLMMDVSNSMLSNDIHPSRIERSKLLVSTLVDRMSNDKVGLGVFAGEAYPLLPITNDFVSAKMFLNDVNADMVSLQGTNMAAAIELASKSFTQEKGVGKAIVIITDGEDHEEGAIEAAKDAAKEGYRVYVLGVGSSQGGTIPTANGPMCDAQGQVVITTVNAELGRQVAEAGKGMYIPVDNTNLAQDQLQGALRQLQQKESVVASDDTADEQFQAVALIALLLLLAELMIMEVKNPLFRRMNLFNKNKTFILSLLLALTFGIALPAQAQSEAYRMVKRGNRAFVNKEYKEAEKYYLRALQEDPRNARIHFNLADTYMAEDNNQEAMKHFADAAKSETNKTVKAMSFHNMGYIHHKQKQYDKAIDYYKEALRNNPNDEDTRYNLALCQRQKKEQQQNQKQQQQNQEQNKQNQDQNNHNEDKNQPQQPDQMSQESVDQLLQLSRQSEDQTRKKLQQQQPPRKKSLLKNW